MSKSEFLTYLEAKSSIRVGKTFDEFQQRLESKRAASRLRFVLTETEMTIRLRPPRPKPTKKGAKEWVPLISFAVQGKREFNKVGVCFVMERLQLWLRDYAYPPSIAQSFNTTVASIDSRLTVGRPLIDQLPLRDLTSEFLSKLENAIDCLVAAIEGEESYVPPSTISPRATSSERGVQTPSCSDNQFPKKIAENADAPSNGLDVDMTGSGKAGFIYILTNPAMHSECLKIGVTTRTSEQRAREISTGTGIPCPFQVAFEVHLDDCIRIERILHEMLSRFRMQSNREFFYMPLKDAIRIVQEIANSQNQEANESRFHSVPQP